MPAPGPDEGADPLTLLDANAANLARLLIRKGLLSKDEVVEALTKPPSPGSKP
jgi:hypothetical protein